MWCWSGGRGISRKLSLCYSIVYCYNGAPVIIPLQRISASWYRPVHHLGFCALPILRCLSFLAYTPNWPVALILLLLHPPGTLYLLRFDCAKTFSRSNATWKPIYSNSVLLCCIKRLCIFGPQGAIQIRYYYYYYYYAQRYKQFVQVDRLIWSCLV